MKYHIQLDGLRFIAISLVLFEHFAPQLTANFKAGYYGVDLFFVLSGFLITSILIQPNELSFRSNYFKFIGRRTLRIFPIYYITIVVLFIMNLGVIHEKLIWFITYTYNYAHFIYKMPFNAVSHFWSLAIEEQFYLVWPFVVLSLKSKPKILIPILLAIIIAGYSQIIFQYISHDTYFLPRMASLALGSLGAVLLSRNLFSEKIFSSLLLESAVLLSLVISLCVKFARIEYLMLGVCSLFLVLKAVNSGFRINLINRFLENKFIVKIGMMAYGIYLFHVPIGYYLSKNWVDPFLFKHPTNPGLWEWLYKNNWVLKLPVYSGLSILLAAFSYRFIEKPILKLKDRYFRY